MSKRKNYRGKSKKAYSTTDKREEYNYHLPVLFQECCDAVLTDPKGIYIDGTLGGGGHSAEIFSRLDTEGRLHSFDADLHAIKHCEERFAEELAKQDKSRIVLHNENFVTACSIVKKDTKEKPHSFVSGVLLDLGVSSLQLDTDSIGLSYRVNSRLNMRFGSQGISAEDCIAETGEEKLVEVLRLYGEEPFAKRIARRMVERRRAAPLRTTFDLREVVEEVVPMHLRSKSLSRVFQAFRIAVNDELRVLETFLQDIIPCMSPGGRIVVISYHSLEDRIVKNIFKEHSRTSRPTENNKFSFTEPISPELKVLTKKPMLPSEEEIRRNPRARSAKLRIAEKC
jgi:16S rRNA (cytosine1402-N4)-methyltransferase